MTLESKGRLTYGTDRCQITKVGTLSWQFSAPCQPLLFTCAQNVSVPLRVCLTVEQRLTNGEAKALEHRSALTPSTTKALLDAGYKVNIERSSQRIFDDSEFEAIGATMLPENSWRDAPNDHIILGLKELPEESCELLDR
jgi:hypothetical protein